MNCAQIKNRFSDYLTGDIDEKTRKEILGHLTRCDACRLELESLSAIWAKLGVIPEEQPGSQLRSRFYEMLEIHKQAQELEAVQSTIGNQRNSWFRRLMSPQPAFQMAFALLFLIVGLAAGLFIRGGWHSSTEIAQLHQEVSQIRQITAASLLSQEALRERLGDTGENMQVAVPDRQALLDFLGQADISPVTDIHLLALDILFPSLRENKQEYLNKLSEQTAPFTEIAKTLASNIGRF